MVRLPLLPRREVAELHRSRYVKVCARFLRLGHLRGPWLPSAVGLGRCHAYSSLNRGFPESAQIGIRGFEATPDPCGDGNGVFGGHLEETGAVLAIGTGH